MFTERTFASSELLLNCATGPATGPPLLLLHGVTRCWTDYLTLAPALAPRWQVFALDFRGHGRSGRVPGKYRVIDYVRDAVAVVRSQLSEPAVVYGHSLGALVASALAAQEPARVRAVVLEDPPGPRLLRELRSSPYHALFSGVRGLAGLHLSLRELADQLADILVPAPNGGEVRLGQIRDATSIRFAARCLQQLDPGVLNPLLEERWLDDYDTDVWSRVACPTLLLRGEVGLGGMLAREEGESMAQRMADCTLIDLPGVGHLIHWMQNEAVARLTVGFLESLR